MVHFMPIVAIMDQCLFDIFYACSVTDMNLKIHLLTCHKNADETAVSVILARPNYLQQCFSVFLVIQSTPNILLIGSYGVGFTISVIDTLHKNNRGCEWGIKFMKRSQL
jgi:hypothetical protein